METKKRFFRAVGRYTFYATRRIISLMPYWVFRGFLSGLILISHPLIRSKKRLAMENLNFAFGQEKTLQEIQGIADSCFDNLATGMIEIIYFIDRKKAIVEKVTIEGQEHLDAALKRGQGAILLTAHFGNFVLMFLRMALAGYKVNCIIRRVRDEEFEKYIANYRHQNGINTIYSLPHRECVGNSLKSLRKNEVLFVLLDQNYGEESHVFVDFFGAPAATATGPVVFAQRSGALILPTFILRENKDHYKIVIEPPVKFEDPTDDGQDVTQKVAQLTKIIEGYVRRYPHEWGGWLHRRWKSKQRA